MSLYSKTLWQSWLVIKHNLRFAKLVVERRIDSVPFEMLTAFITPKQIVIIVLFKIERLHLLILQRCDTVRLSVVVYLMRTGTPVIGSILTEDAAVHNVKQLQATTRTVCQSIGTYTLEGFNFHFAS